MSLKDISPSIARLDRHVDNVEDKLQPVLENLGPLASQLPLLDKAKLFALTAYSINALLHSAIRIEGGDAQSHPVSTELKRVQQYFAKIKDAETKPGPRENMSVNTEAAARVLKHDLGSNDAELKRKLEEQIAKERAKALLQSIGRPGKRPAEQPAEEDPGEEDPAEEDPEEDKEATSTPRNSSGNGKSKKKRRNRRASGGGKRHKHG